MNLTLKIIIVTFIAFIMENVFPPVIRVLSLKPSLALHGYYWQFLTYVFMHASFSHIFINMFVLLMFGSSVERVLGKTRFGILYFLSGIGSALFHIMLTHGEDVLLLGASGATFGVMAAYAYLFPKNWIIIFPGIPMPASLLIVFLIFFEFFLGITGLEPGIANFGHVGGIITALVFMPFLKRRRRKGMEDIEFIWE